jgi:hypothetical protein
VTCDFPNSQTTYMISAGHCANLGAAVKTHGQLMGDVVNRRLANGTIDAERINDLGGGYNGSVWGGGPTDTSPPTYIEDGSLFAQPGSLVTNDSATSGEVRGITVDAVNQMLTEGGITTVLLTKVSKGGARICAGGNSGGPWIQHEGSTEVIAPTGIDGFSE